MDDGPVSKVLVLDRSPEYSDAIKQFCEHNGLVALKVRKDAVMSVLRTNIDLGGILYSEGFCDTSEETLQLAVQIHAMRPELPIIIRRALHASLEDIPADSRHVFSAAYVGSDMEVLRSVINRYIFCLLYPNALLRGIAEITAEVLGSEFPSLRITQESPFIVHDRIIFGEVLSLIQLESSWCRGYMMLQTQEDPFLELIGCEKTEASSRRLNGILAEMTNRIWGSFKNRFIGSSQTMGHVQVPLVINHKHKYISFGTENPQLCFRYTVSDETRFCTLYERFIFNLNWAPDGFRELAPDAAALVDSGELELF